MLAPGRMLLLLALPVSLLACGSDDDGQATPDADTVAVDTSDTGETGDAADVPVAPAEPGVGTPEERGLVDARVIAHLHSAYSHDACDEEGLDEDGNPNWPCVQNMKDALCLEAIDVAFMTDHPSYLRDQPFEDLLYADESAGDVVHRDAEGTAWGVTFACPEGQGGLDGQARLMVGFEGTHTMPLGLRRHLDDPAHYSISFTDGTSSEDLDTLTTSVRDAGGFVSIAHSEETDLDWQLIADHDVTAMEIYNFHANFNVLFDSGQLDAIFEMEPFVGTAGDPGDPDLAALILLGHYPEPALDKWRKVSSVRPITPIAGSDVHENVIIPGICALDLCADLAEDYPNMVVALAAEGPLMMPDGERLDSYGRIFRWVQNRVRIDADADPVTSVEAALEAGRNVVVFELLGNPPGVDLIALGTDGAVLEIGETLVDDVAGTLWARAPVAPTPGRTASWTDGSSAEITATVYRSHAGETTAVGSTDTPGAWIAVPLTEPGAYHLEVMITPHHLAGAMGSAKDYASHSYRWVETGAIRVISSPTLETP